PYRGDGRSWANANHASCDCQHIVAPVSSTIAACEADTNAAACLRCASSPSPRAIDIGRTTCSVVEDALKKQANMRLAELRVMSRLRHVVWHATRAGQTTDATT